MKRQQVIVLVITLLMIALSSWTADAEPPFPPATEGLFTDHVRVLSTEIVEDTGVPIRVRSDDSARTIHVLNGRSYPYLDNFAYVVIFEQDWTNDDYLIPVHFNNSIYLSVGVDASDTRAVWRLDLQTGEYTLIGEANINTPCGEINLGVLGEPWVVIDRDERQFLCELSTGILSEALPLGWNFGNPFAISLDGRYVLLIGKYPIYLIPRNPATIFAFDTLTNRIHVIDPLLLGEYTRFNGWVDGTYLFLLETGERPEWSERTVAVLDASQRNGFRDLLTNMRFAPEYYPDPPRLQAFHGWANFLNGLPYCWIESIDLRSWRKSITTYPEGLCVPEYGDPMGVAYFRNVGKGRVFPAPTQLIRYDAATDKQQVLFEGEIERIMWVSRDERYALIELDNDGEIDAVSGYYGGSGTEPHAQYGFGLTMADGTYSNPQHAIVDLSSGQLIYTQSGSWNDWDAPIRTLTPLTDRLLLIFAESRFEQVNNPEQLGSRLLHISESGVSERVLDTSVAPFPVEHGCLLVLSQDGSLNLYDALADISLPVTLPTSDYEIRVEAAQGTHATLAVYPVGIDAVDERRLVRYTLQIPALCRLM
jgi:hypothetical protein